MATITCEPGLNSYDHKRHHAACKGEGPALDGQDPTWDFVVTQQNGGAVKLAPNQPAGGMMPVMWSLPPLVVHTTTAEEDARLHAPCA